MLPASGQSDGSVLSQSSGRGGHNAPGAKCRGGLSADKAAAQHGRECTLEFTVASDSQTDDMQLCE